MNQQPYPSQGYNKLYNLLFADDINLYQPNNETKSVYPWNVLMNDRAAVADLQGVAADTTIESRLRALAFNMLRFKGYKQNSKELLGIIVEVALDEGLDTLAAYKDGSARYINHSEKMTVWDTTTAESQSLIRNLFSAGLEVVKQIGPWEKDRLPAPKNGDIRISFLVADGLYFGQGPFEVLEKDRIGAPVVRAATQLMVFLVNQQHPGILAHQ
ncbi:MAG: hypothetical protein QM764_24435 [Chitinophagaceae bacterium]